METPLATGRNDAVSDRGLIRRLLQMRSSVLPAAVLLSIPVGLVLYGLLVAPVAAPMDHAVRLVPPSRAHPFGGDGVGRDLFNHVVHGGLVSLTIGVMVAILSTVTGLFLGLLAGFVRAVDAVLMRVMDGMMAIPGLLLAIAMMAIAGSSVINVIIAITIADIPRVVRLVRAMVLSLRDQLFVDAAIVAGNGTRRILLRHILPQTLGPLSVQATFICTSAIITEAYLSFIGAGTPPDMPSWGNIIAEGRNYFRQAPWIVLIPGCLIATTVLAINLIGDALRDALDPRVAKNL